MRARQKWLAGSMALAVIAIIVIVLVFTTRGSPPFITISPAAAFTSIENEVAGTVDIELVISPSTDASLIIVLFSVNGTNFWAHAPLSSSPSLLVLEDGREFTLTYGDKDADGMVESRDHISITGPFDGDEYRIDLLFEPTSVTVCSVIVRAN